jgi:hypothetical protein
VLFSVLDVRTVPYPTIIVAYTIVVLNCMYGTRTVVLMRHRQAGDDTVCIMMLGTETAPITHHDVVVT